MAKNPPHSTETIGIEGMGAPDEAPAGTSRKNIPVLMVLQGETPGKKFLLSVGETIIGRSPEAEITLSDSEISRKHAAVVYEPPAEKGGPPSCVVRDLDSKNGTRINGRRTASHVLRDKDVIAAGSTVLAYYLKDEIELKFDAELYSLATLDPLTGLFNKYYFHREYHREFYRSQRTDSPLSMCFCDLDHFKGINDTHGHLAGDFILRKIGEIFLCNMREYDMSARYGGEEFVVVLPATPMDAAVTVAERLRKTVESYVFQFQEQTIPVTISVGIAALGPEMESPQQLLQSADNALLKAKESGRNRIVTAHD
jgi:two-component system cell cycle response regulator